MSFIKRHLEREAEANNLVAALQVLLDYEIINNPTSKGISKKIISDRSVDELSPKQLEVFDNYIHQVLEPSCEGHCNGEIDILDLPNAYLSEFEEGGLYCQHCIYDRQKLNAE